MKFWSEKSFKYYGLFMFLQCESFPSATIQTGEAGWNVFPARNVFRGFKVFAWLNAMKIKGGLRRI